MPIISGGAAGNTTAQVVASGKVLPVAGPSGATVDTTTYDNEVTASGKFTTLVFPTDNGALALAVAGDAHPRVLLTASGADGVYLGTGTVPITSANNLYAASNTELELSTKLTVDGVVTPGTATAGSHAPRIEQLSPVFAITSGGLPTVQLVSGAAAQISLIRDAEAVTPVTFNPTAGANATCQVELSPDNVTYTTLGYAIEPLGVVFDGARHLVSVRVPAGWLLRLTTVNATLGTTTYY